MNLLSDFITIDECFHSLFKSRIFKGNYSLVKICSYKVRLLSNTLMYYVKCLLLYEFFLNLVFLILCCDEREY